MILLRCAGRRVEGVQPLPLRDPNSMALLLTLEPECEGAREGRASGSKGLEVAVEMQALMEGCGAHPAPDIGQVSAKGPQAPAPVPDLMGAEPLATHHSYPAGGRRQWQGWGWGRDAPPDILINLCPTTLSATQLQGETTLLLPQAPLRTDPDLGVGVGQQGPPSPPPTATPQDSSSPDHSPSQSRRSHSHRPLPTPCAHASSSPPRPTPSPCSNGPGPDTAAAPLAEAGSGLDLTPSPWPRTTHAAGGGAVEGTGAGTEAGAGVGAEAEAGAGAGKDSEAVVRVETGGGSWGGAQGVPPPACPAPNEDTQPLLKGLALGGSSAPAQHEAVAETPPLPL